MTKIALEFDDRALVALEAAFARVPQLNLTRPMRAAASALRKAWKVKLPRPGYPGDRTEERSLYASMGAKVKEVRDKLVVYAVVGADRSKGGYHSHLVEEGHEVVTHRRKTGIRTKAPKYGQAAEAETREARSRAVVEGVAKELERALAGS
jgi:hypothetical protein